MAGCSWRVDMPLYIDSAEILIGNGLNNGLVLYFPFSGNANDQSGNGHNGLIYGPTYTANGRIGGAYQYDGTNDYILAGNLGVIGQGTISFWMYADAVENWRNPFSTDYASGDDCIRFEESASGHFGGGGKTYTTNLEPRTWTHVAFAWTTNDYWGWLNGQLAFSGSHNNQLYLNFNNVAIGNGYSVESTDTGRAWWTRFEIYNRVLACKMRYRQVYQYPLNSRAPWVEDISVSLDEDNVMDISLVGSDPESEEWMYSIVAPPSHGEVLVDGDMATYLPDANYYGSDTFTYRANDGTLDSNVGTVTLQITNVNDTPILEPIEDQVVDEGQLLEFSILGFDVDGDVLSYSMEGLPAGAHIDPATHTFRWTPDL